VLIELEIENFALVESLRVPFGAGLNVLTGETGAGKSIVLDALGYLLGDAHPQSRPLEKKNSRVCGLFEAKGSAWEWLVSQGLLDEGGGDEAGWQVLLARDTTPQGRSQSRVNGRLASLSQIRQLANFLVEIHGQHQSTSLLKPAKHLQLLDVFAGEAHLGRVNDYRQVYQEDREIARRLQELEDASRTKAREQEWLSHEVQEIEEADLKLDEEDTLENDWRRLSHLDEIHTKVSTALNVLEGDRGAGGSIIQAQKSLGSVVRLDSSLQEHLTELDQCQVVIQETARSLMSYLDQTQADPRQLERLSDRKALIKTLKRKYGSSIEEILNYAQSSQEKLSQLENQDALKEQLSKDLETVRARRTELANQLTDLRIQHGDNLCHLVEQELHELYLEKSKFQVKIDAQDAGPNGNENVEFQFSANPGSPLRPLHKVASGGELSRLLLALLVLLDRDDPVPTMVLDEVDSGLGGRAAEAVAAKLTKICWIGSDEATHQRQIICVTHLPVIAASADHHLRVVKSAEDEHTHLFVGPLDEEGRELEIARMLSGDATPGAARTHARELISKQRPRRTL
jgi:DNA repair protein RecN (Recombination protein N)